MLKLFDREDGKAADWPLIAETLFLEAFRAVDQAPHNERMRSMLHRVHDGSYARLMALPSDPYKDQERAPAAAPLSDYEGPQLHFSDAPKA